MHTFKKLEIEGVNKQFVNGPEETFFIDTVVGVSPLGEVCTIRYRDEYFSMCYSDIEGVGHKWGTFVGLYKYYLAHNYTFYTVSTVE